jgi:hypothetical protein
MSYLNPQERSRRNAGYFLIAAVLMAVAAVMLFAPGAGAATITCVDGRQVEDTRSSPFEPNPCLAPAGAPAVSDEFLLVFGPPPTRAEFPSTVTGWYTWRAALGHWRQSLKYFGGVVEQPQSTSPSIVDRAAETYLAWNIPAPVYYKGRYGVGARFNPPVGRAYEASGRAAALYPGLIVANYQIRQVREGYCVPRLYPTVPPAVRAANRALCE